MTERDEQTPVWQRFHRWRRWAHGGRAAARIAPSEQGWLPWAEAFVMTVLACAAAGWAMPGDPLLLTARFPWLWFAPLLIALRYGLTLGAFSVSLLALDWAVYGRLAPSGAAHFPLPAFVGGVLCTVICGEFRAIWANRVAHRDEANLYLEGRLTRLTRRYFMLQLSHDRLEQIMIARPGSLRDALRQLRDTIARRPDADVPLPGIDYVLQLLSQYCRLEEAGVYIPRRHKSGTWIAGDPVAKTGNPPPLESDDPMLAHAMAHREVTHVATELTDSGKHLIMAPILGINDSVLGLLVVSSMPFLSFNRDTLQILALLLGYYGEMLQVSPKVDRVRTILPECPYEFADEMVRLSHVAGRIGVESHLVVMVFNGAGAEQAADEVERSRRGLDLIWRRDPLTLAVLLPFAAVAGSRGYVQRIEHQFADSANGQSTTREIQIHEFVLGAEPLCAGLVSLLQVREPPVLKAAADRVELLVSAQGR